MSHIQVKKLFNFIKGVVLWEIFSLGESPYPGYSWTLEFLQTIINGYRMNAPPFASIEL
jgi:hypothetical protein